MKLLFRNISDLFLKKIFIFNRNADLWIGETDKPFICWFTSQLAIMAEAELIQSQKQGDSCVCPLPALPTKSGCRVRSLGPSSVNLPGHKQWNRQDAEQPKHETECRHLLMIESSCHPRANFKFKGRV